MGEYSRAYVEFIESDNVYPSYRNRRISFMNGDGLTYVYEETKNEFYDYRLNTGTSMHFKPQVMLLKKIKDRFGHTIDLNYTNMVKDEFGNNTYVYGRPLLSSINGNWENSYIGISYHTPSGLAVIVQNYKSQFKILCEGQQGNFDSTGNHRFYPTRIVNPYGNYASLSYEDYSRTATEVHNPNPGGSTMNLVFNENLRRISKFINYYGGEIRYEYLSSGDLSIDMLPAEFEKICSSDGNYHGQGRDCFFVNMLNKKEIYKDNNEISEESFTYPYENGSRNFRLDPVNDSDDYYTSRTLTNNSTNGAGTIFNTYPSRTSVYHYKNYKIKVTSNTRQEYPDWQGNIKLINEKYFTSDINNPERTVSHFFLANDVPGNVVLKSFLDTAVVDSIKGIPRRIRMDYTHFSAPFSGTEIYRNPLKQLTQYNPFLTKTINNFDYKYEKSIHFKYAKFNANTSTQEYDTTYFYRINIPLKTEILSTSNNLLYRDSSHYNYTNSDTGYISQLTFKRVFNAIFTSDYKEIKYEYFVRDTIGKGLYPMENTKPSNEGNLKSITDA